MANSFKIVWTSRASKNLEKTLLYLKQNWTSKEVKNFTENLERFILVIQKHPDSFPISQKYKPSRRAVITKLNTLYYRLDSNVITILTLFDTRQSVRKIRL